MKPGAVYTLERGAEVLGTLTVTGAGPFAIDASFKPTPAFDPYRVLFDEDARYAHLIAQDDDPALLEQAGAIQESLLALNLVLRREGNVGFRTFLLSIEGAGASFRPLTPEEEPL
ncbi:hypothetical protein GCM10017784_19310 [Deinococcus indicus]|uniref:hypothetical protein n=1 Tax=Deinococcus indicus TaxID=223556 RepID=UPI0017485F4F|nr:hypothetical protein [Deinococcus indicus]GHG27008.1 hypothetical protein GCM10017784_19310 [Deinococcus indicus]